MEQHIQKPNPEGITPKLARQDYINQIAGIRVCMDPAISGPVSDELFRERLMNWRDKGGML